MFDPISAGIIGGGSLLGGIASGLFGASSQDKANESNIQSAREQMGFQERMSSTSYQRGMEDMRKAGLNPMLAFSQGGASSPSGAAGNSQGFTPNDPITPAVNATMLAKQTQANTDVAKTQALKNIQDAQTSAKQADLTAVQTQVMKKDLPRSEIMNKIYKYGTEKWNQFNGTSGKKALDDANNAIKYIP